jgi:hypothetical protein
MCRLSGDHATDDPEHRSQIVTRTVRAGTATLPT